MFVEILYLNPNSVFYFLENDLTSWILRIILVVWQHSRVCL